MTKTIHWLSIFVISAVLIAGSLAMSPMAVADGDKHDDESKVMKDAKKSNKVVQETYNLSGFPGPEIAVIIDTTNVNDMLTGHWVATLPNQDNECNEGDSPAAGLAVLVAAADNTGGDTVAIVTGEGTNTGIGLGRIVSFGGDDVVTCVFHFDFVAGMEGTALGSGDIITIDTISDIAFVNLTTEELPSGTSISVSAKLGKSVSVDSHS